MVWKALVEARCALTSAPLRVEGAVGVDAGDGPTVTVCYAQVAVVAAGDNPITDADLLS
jgi:hypothetical protein